jgi:hypothetical protein
MALSTKLQINHSASGGSITMTKTLIAVRPYRSRMLCPPLIMPFGTIAGEPGVWNFEFGSLEFV